MGFAEHFNDIEDMIDDNRSGEYKLVHGYGYGIEDFINEEANPIVFWASEKVRDDLEEVDIELQEPLVVENYDYELGDIYFETKCIGYAIQKQYDSVIIETSDMSYYITIDFVDEEQYLSEAGKKRTGPLAGKKISKEKRQEIMRKRDLATKHKKLGRSTQIKRPKKAPPQGIRVDVLLSNTGYLSPARVDRAMKEVRKQPPKITGVKEEAGRKYFRAEYNFKSINSTNRQMGYADISQDKKYCKELFCTCADFFFRLYAPYVAAGLSTWNVPPKYKSRQTANVEKAPHNKSWTVDTNPSGKLFLCKHLWAFLAYYVAGDAGNVELSDEEISEIIGQYFKDVDGDGEEEPVDSPFQRAYGKLYVGQKGKDIEQFDRPEDVKGGEKRVFYQLPKDNKKEDEEEEA